MAKVIDPQKLKFRRDKVPGLKAAICSFTPQDLAAPQEAEDFRRLVRDLRRQGRSKIATP